MFSPLYQILRALCPGPEYHAVMKNTLTTSLGTVQIMVGLFNIGLGPGRTSMSPGDLTNLGAAYWLGAVFIVTGILSILTAQFPSSGFVGFTIFMNIAGAIFAITGIVLYAIDLRDASFFWMCENDEDNCRTVAVLAQRLLVSMDATLIALAVLQLSVNVRFAILGIGALTTERKKEEDGKDVEDLQPQLKEVLLTSPGA